jgi:heptosyltransferase I
VRTIQAQWPGTSITWIIGNTEYELFKGIDGVEFITLNKSRGIAGYLDLRRRLKGRRFPVLLHMHASMRANIASLMVRADVRIGFDKARARDRQWLFTNRKIPARPEQHVMDGLFSFIETLGVNERTVAWDIPVSQADLQFARDLRRDDRPLCVISPCTSQRFRNYRNWRPENYVAVAEYLDDKYGAHVVLTGSSTDTELQYGREIESGTSFPVTNLIGKTSLKRLLAVLESADLLICPDSGPAHMATAVGTPVIGLYATSNTHRTGPYFSQQLVVDEYPEAVRREFDKPVGALRWGQRVRDPDAMDLIKVDRVLGSIETVLGAGQDDSPEHIAPDSGLG